MRCVLEGVRNAAASSVWLLAAAHRHNKRAGSLSAGRVSYCVEKKLTVTRPHLNRNTHNVPVENRNGNYESLVGAWKPSRSITILRYYNAI